MGPRVESYFKSLLVDHGQLYALLSISTALLIKNYLDHNNLTWWLFCLKKKDGFHWVCILAIGFGIVQIPLSRWFEKTEGWSE